ncbi:hypothetical protein [Streptomyces sp. NPDC093598]|uniref:hypothetical protein n=1 Tax=Streptomyces sp. NPDC093598 TaxID=3366046 RepID=UPI003815DADC
MVSPPPDDQGTPAPPHTRERPSRLIDVVVALLLLVADAVIIVTAAILFVVVGMGSAESAHSPATMHTRDVPVLTWLVIWGIPAVAATGAVVHARLRMPVTAVVQSLFTLTCALMAVMWTRMLLS